MDRAKVIKEDIVEQDTHFLAVYIEARNSCWIMLSEKEDKMGTLALAVPNPKGLAGPVTSQTLLGERNAISARMLAEYIASKKGKITMVSVYLEKLNEIQAQKIFMNLIEKVFIKENQKESIRT
ncbi:MAG TPA: hypothetical protein VMX17_10695 [Candidatus Glassbacteria bacterium]|nr:hypothetical protein [Candidatus Glassbacteria bacterium]